MKNSIISLSNADIQLVYGGKASTTADTQKSNMDAILIDAIGVLCIAMIGIGFYYIF